MFTKLLKFIGLMGLVCLSLFLWPRGSWAADMTYPYYNFSEIYGDINLEFRSRGFGDKNLSLQTQHDFIHYYNLGFRSYIWDQRFIQYNVLGNFYQDLRFGDVTGDNDYYRFGGTGSITFLPRSILPVTLIYARDMNFNPDITNTHYEVDAMLILPNWPRVDLALSRDNYFSDDKNFRQDTDYTNARLNFYHTIFFKPKRVSRNGNGNGNGDEEYGEKKNGNGNGTPTPPSSLVIIGYYDYFNVEDKIKNLSTQQHLAQLSLNYYFNNFKSYIYNIYDWNRSNNNDRFRVSLSYYNQLPTQLSYNLQGYFTYSRPEVGNSSFEGGLSASLSKVFSPQWRADVGLAGQFASDGNGGTTYGISGFGNIFSRIFKDFDWGSSISGGINASENNTRSNFALSLFGLYRLAPNKTLSANYGMSFISGDGQSQGIENRFQLAFDGNWAPRFTFRSIAEFRLQNLSGDGGGGNNMIVSWDNYGIYRLSPQTNLTAGVYFTHNSPASGESDQRFRVYATLTSSPWWNLRYSLTAELNYEVKSTRWTVRVYPQVYYVWRKLYFSLQGEFDYFNENSRNGWNYNVTFKVTRPFSLVF